LLALFDEALAGRGIVGATWPDRIDHRAGNGECGRARPIVPGCSDPGVPLGGAGFVDIMACRQCTVVTSAALAASSTAQPKTTSTNATGLFRRGKKAFIVPSNTSASSDSTSGTGNRFPKIVSADEAGQEWSIARFA